MPPDPAMVLPTVDPSSLPEAASTVRDLKPKWEDSPSIRIRLAHAWLSLARHTNNSSEAYGHARQIAALHRPYEEPEIRAILAEALIWSLAYEDSDTNADQRLAQIESLARLDASHIPVLLSELTAIGIRYGQLEFRTLGDGQPLADRFKNRHSLYRLYHGASERIRTLEDWWRLIGVPSPIG